MSPVVLIERSGTFAQQQRACKRGRKSPVASLFCPPPSCSCSGPPSGTPHRSAVSYGRLRPPDPPVMTATVRCQAAFGPAGPHRLITLRNGILTDGPMRIDPPPPPPPPPSEYPRANESFPFGNRVGSTPYLPYIRRSRRAAAPPRRPRRLYLRLPRHPSPPLRPSCASLPPSFSPCAVVVFHRGERAGAVNTALLRP